MPFPNYENKIIKEIFESLWLKLIFLFILIEFVFNSRATHTHTKPLVVHETKTLNATIHYVYTHPFLCIYVCLDIWNTFITFYAPCGFHQKHTVTTVAQNITATYGCGTLNVLIYQNWFKKKRFRFGDISQFKEGCLLVNDFWEQSQPGAWKLITLLFWPVQTFSVIHRILYMCQKWRNG